MVGRLAKLFLDMAAEERGSPPRLTEDEMAALVGSVRDVIGRALKQMDTTGAIKVDGRRILVVSQEKLRKVTQSPTKVVSTEVQVH